MKGLLDMKLKNYVLGKWVEGEGEGTPLINPINNQTLAHATSKGIDLKSALEFTRESGSVALQKLTYAQRAQLLSKMSDTLKSNRDTYYKIALENSGNTLSDARVDVDGGIGTLKYYSAIGAQLGEKKFLIDSNTERLSRDKNFQATHISTPLKGAAIQINAFNFPSWGMWEKVAVSILSGVAAFIKPASATCILSNEMLKDIIKADILPVGALSMICGGGHDLLNHVKLDDVVLFTGSADTALKLKTTPQVLKTNVRFNAETDSLNSCILGKDVNLSDDLYTSFIREVVNEMSVKAGQKCTAIRRIFVPEDKIDDVSANIVEALSKITMGDPKDESVKLGPLVDKKQHDAALAGLETLKTESQVLTPPLQLENLVGEGVNKDCFFAPTLLRCDNPVTAKMTHEVEVFGPVATLMPYQDYDELWKLVSKGNGSLVSSMFSNDQATFITGSIEMSSCNGRLLLIDETIQAAHTGHGNVMPQCIHGGPGRAGGGQELGGLRALTLYHQQTAVQSNSAVLEKLLESGATL